MSDNCGKVSLCSDGVIELDSDGKIVICCICLPDYQDGINDCLTQISIDSNAFVGHTDSRGTFKRIEYNSTGILTGRTPTDSVDESGYVYYQAAESETVWTGSEPVEWRDWMSAEIIDGGRFVKSDMDTILGGSSNSFAYNYLISVCSAVSTPFGIHSCNNYYSEAGNASSGYTKYRSHDEIYDSYRVPAFGVDDPVPSASGTLPARWDEMYRFEEKGLIARNPNSPLELLKTLPCPNVINSYGNYDGNCSLVYDGIGGSKKRAYKATITIGGVSIDVLLEDKPLSSSYRFRERCHGQGVAGGLNVGQSPYTNAPVAKALGTNPNTNGKGTMTGEAEIDFDIDSWGSVSTPASGTIRWSLSYVQSEPNTLSSKRSTTYGKITSDPFLIWTLRPAFSTVEFSWDPYLATQSGNLDPLIGTNTLADDTFGTVTQPNLPWTITLHY